jgi:hypothetical protein
MMELQSKDEWLAVRHAEAKLIDPRTARVRWHWGHIFDPYGIDPDLPSEQRHIGRLLFACRPGSKIWVSFFDLPDNVRLAFRVRVYGDRPYLVAERRNDTATATPRNAE